MTIRIIACLCGLLLLSSCSEMRPQVLRADPDAPRVRQASTRPVDDAYQTVQANLVRCFGNGSYIIAATPGTDTLPAQINVNSSLGYLFATVDFTATAAGSVAVVAISFPLKRQRRLDEWQAGLKAWLVDGDTQYCARMP